MVSFSAPLRNVADEQNNALRPLREALQVREHRPDAFGAVHAQAVAKIALNWVLWLESNYEKKFREKCIMSGKTVNNLSILIINILWRDSKCQSICIFQTFRNDLAMT